SAGTYDFIVQHQPDTVYRLSLAFVTLVPIPLFGIASALAFRQARMYRHVRLMAIRGHGQETNTRKN
ncbi:hypothetical protein HKBW3C_02293, partial [Candidatus Hakubella thermalkaliphila]